MPTTITSAELLPMLGRAREYVSLSTVGFVRAYEKRQAKEPRPEDFVADLGGSGTLVQTDETKGILTADHVLDELPDFFGLVLPTLTGDRHQRTIIQASKRIRIGRGQEPSKGPDLALVILSAVDANNLETQGAVFYNLASRGTRMLCQPLRLDKHSALILCGMVGEWTRDTTPMRGLERAKSFRGIFGPVVLAAERQTGEFDYFSVEVSYEGNYTGPASFKGCSGGSVWHVSLKRDSNGTVQVSDPLLCGLPFYESGDNGGRGHIECHGAQSIYGAVIDALRKGHKAR